MIVARRFRLSHAVVQRLHDAGLPVAKIFEQASVPASALAGPRVVLATAELFAVYKAIAEHSDDPAIGLVIGSPGKLERYDPVALAGLSARTFRDALERASRYKLLTCPEQIKVSVRGDECRVQFDWLLADEPEPPVLSDLCFAWVTELARRGTANAVNPKRVELRRRPAARARYKTYFGCPLVFGARADALVFDRAALDHPFVTHNAELLAMVAPQLEAELAEQAASESVREQVKWALKRTLAGRRPELGAVARELAISTRTLQRRLGEERVTFQQVVAEARRELARHYLSHSTLELDETAYLLGYEDANSFFRAFHQWEGTTPGAWRKRTARRGSINSALRAPSASLRAAS